MAKINFKSFKVFTGPSRKESLEGDVRESLSDLLYKQGTGAAALSLSTRIYESDGEMELRDEDIQYLKGFANQFCTPQFISSIDENITD